MLTRLRVHGFKNLLHVDVAFGPLTCIAGPNASGKSNLLDAISLLSLLADHPLDEAARRLRAPSGGWGDPAELFWTDGERRADRIDLSAEMIVPPKVFDDVGRSAEPAITFLRYDVSLGLAAPGDGPGRLVLLSEELRHVRVSDASAHLRFPHSARSFRAAVVSGRRSGTAFVSTHPLEVAGEGAVPHIHVHQDGGTGAEPTPTRADRAPRTILSTTTTSALPTLLAARRELQAWRRLSLDPARMRRPDRIDAPAGLAATGAGLAATLADLLARSPDPAAAGAALDAQLGRLADLDGVRVDPDPGRGVWMLRVRERGGHWMPQWALSDGTVRMVALAVLAQQATQGGVLCLEEPENGIHPARLDRVRALLDRVVIDPTRAPGPGNPLHQVLLTTHSPSFVRMQRDADLLVSTQAPASMPGGPAARALRLRPLAETWRCDADEPGIPRARLVELLSAPVGGQVGLL